MFPVTDGLIRGGTREHQHPSPQVHEGGACERGGVYSKPSSSSKTLQAPPGARRQGGAGTGEGRGGEGLDPGWEVRQGEGLDPGWEVRQGEGLDSGGGRENEEGKNELRTI